MPVQVWISFEFVMFHSDPHCKATAEVIEVACEGTGAQSLGPWLWSIFLVVAAGCRHRTPIKLSLSHGLESIMPRRSKSSCRYSTQRNHHRPKDTAHDRPDAD